MNSCNFTGRIATDIEHRMTNSNVSCCNFKLAVQRKYKNANGERQADFIPCVAYRYTADFLVPRVGKGDMIAVEGSLQTRQYTAQDGSKRNAFEIIVEDVTICATKNAKANEPAQNDQMTEADDVELPFER